MIGALIGAGAALLGGAFGANANKGANEQSYNNSVRMFNLQNAYNTPLAQRQRLVEAGLNPALMYGGGGVSNTAQSPSRPDVKPVNPAGSIPEAVQAYFNYTMMDKQKELIDATISHKAQAMQESAFNMNLKNEMKPYSISESVARAAKAVSSGDVDRFNVRKGESLLSGQLDLQQADIANKKAGTSYLEERTAGQVLDNFAKSITNKYLDEFEKQKLSKLKEDIQLVLRNQGNVSANTVRTQIQQRIDTQIRELREKGLSPNDSWIIRQLEELDSNLNKVID